MAATFDPALANDVSKVRQLYGDTDITNAKFQDETINAYLQSGLSVLRTAAQLCRDLAARYADQVNTAVDHQQTWESDLYKHYMDLAATLEKRIPKEAAVTDAGFCGISAGVDPCKPIFDPDDTYGYFWEPGVGFPLGGSW